MEAANNKRIAKNTIFLYFRMLLIMAVSLYTSRVILRALGDIDYGIYNVIGGIIGLISFANSSMSISVQRFLSYALGKHEIAEVSNIYSMAINIHVILAITMAIIALIFSKWIVTCFLDIPIERQYEATILFWLVVFSCVCTVIQIPFIGLIITYEKMNLLAMLGIVEALLRLGIAFLMIYLPTDKLIVYGILLLGVSMITLFFYYLTCHKLILSVRYKLSWNKEIFSSLSKFAAWSSLGELSWALTNQGVGIVLNIFFGVLSNTAYGIASQISAAVNKFVSSFQTAIIPPIIKNYASGDINYAMSMTYRGIKFSFYLILMISIPSIACMENIIHLWLGNIPKYTVHFATLTIIALLTDSLSNLFSTVAKATGNIKKYQLYVSAILCLNFPISYLILYLGSNASSVYIVYIILSAILLVIRLRIIGELIRSHIIENYFKFALYPILKVLLFSVAVCTPIYFATDNNNIRLVLLIIGSIIAVSFSAFSFGMNSLERMFVINSISTFISKFRKH